MPIYREATAETRRVTDEMTEKYHPRLAEFKVTIDLLFAFPALDQNGDPAGPALTHGGYQCAAVVKVNPYKLRVQGHGDAEIVIDGEKWDELDDEERCALIDHELEHLEIVHDKDGGVKYDDHNRPKLRSRKHDRQFGWFDVCVYRHGRASVEHQQAYEFIREQWQGYWLELLEKHDSGQTLEPREFAAAATANA